MIGASAGAPVALRQLFAELPSLDDAFVIVLHIIKEIGGVTIAQDQESLAIYGMPRSAVETGALDFMEDWAKTDRTAVLDLF